MIDVDGLQKAFGKKREVEAVRGVTFAAPDGEITGLLGPNGAWAASTSLPTGMPFAAASACCRMRAVSIRG